MANKHLTEVQMVRFIDKTLNSEELAEIKLHISYCRSCRINLVNFWENVEDCKNVVVTKTEIESITKMAKEKLEKKCTL